MLRKVKVPSRVNIIGEHTDYLGGLAMPFACSLYLEITVDTNPSGIVAMLRLLIYGNALAAGLLKFMLRARFR